MIFYILWLVLKCLQLVTTKRSPGVNHHENSPNAPKPGRNGWFPILICLSVPKILRLTIMNNSLHTYMQYGRNRPETGDFLFLLVPTFLRLPTTQLTWCLIATKVVQMCLYSRNQLETDEFYQFGVFLIWLSYWFLIFYFLILILDVSS